MKKGYVYILSNYNRTTFYIGVTNNIETRVAEHRNGTASAFTARYKLFYLLYFEEFQSIQLAIAREKQLKRWHREWKLNLIRTVNPDLKDLTEQ
ncbi:MAG: GIY-YIG nuclease family protein [Bacteroidota bacterium]|nr:GIY-YIG nuclease family protein [Bacteroidota bacterium]